MGRVPLHEFNRIPSTSRTDSTRLRALATRKMPGSLSQRVDAEDIVQSVFRTFFQRAAEGHYDVPEGEDIWKLLLVMVLNKIRDLGDFHRAARRDLRWSDSGATYDQAIESVSGQDDSALVTLRQVIEEVLETLPPSHRPIIGLRIEGYEMAEIAERTQRSKRTVERVLQEFRQSLGARLRESA